MIGVNTAIFTNTSTSVGIGFAIPAATVARVVPQLIARGAVERAGLGFQPAPDPVARAFKISEGGLVGLLALLGGGLREAGCPGRQAGRQAGRRAGGFWGWHSQLAAASVSLSSSPALTRAMLRLLWSLLAGVLIQTADPKGPAAAAGLLPTRRGLGGIVAGVLGRTTPAERGRLALAAGAPPRTSSAPPTLPRMGPPPTSAPPLPLAPRLSRPTPVLARPPQAT